MRSCFYFKLPLLLTLFSILWLPNSLWAGQVANRKILGISKDIRYLAYQENWTFDESLIEVCQIYFIEIPKNKYAAKPIKVVVDPQNNKNPSPQSPCKTATKQAQATLKRLGIKANIQPRRVVHHTLQEVFPPSQKEVIEVIPSKNTLRSEKVKFNITEVPPFPGWKRQFAEIKLKEKPAKPEEELCMGELKMIQLTLNLAGKTYRMQDDQSLPKSRIKRCPLGYRIGEVYLANQEKSLGVIVFLDMFTYDVEGPSRYSLIVTGQYNMN